MNGSLLQTSIVALFCLATPGCSGSSLGSGSAGEQPCVAGATMAASSLSSNCTTGYGFNGTSQGDVSFAYYWGGSRGSDTLTAAASMDGDDDHTVTITLDDATGEVTFDVENEANVTIEPDAKPNTINVLSQVDGEQRRSTAISCPELEDEIDHMETYDEASGNLTCPDLDLYLDGLDAAQIMFTDENLPRLGLAHVMAREFPKIVEKSGTPNKAAAIPVVLALATVFGIGFHTDNFDVCFGLGCSNYSGGSSEGGSSGGGASSDAWNVDYTD